jgi:hypothetical protein
MVGGVWGKGGYTSQGNQEAKRERGQGEAIPFKGMSPVIYFFQLGSTS